MMAQIAGYKDEFIREVENSYIPEDMKSLFSDLINTRMSIIG